MDGNVKKTSQRHQQAQKSVEKTARKLAAAKKGLKHQRLSDKMEGARRVTAKGSGVPLALIATFYGVDLAFGFFALVV